MGEGSGRGSGRVGSELIVGNRGSGRVNVSPGRVGSGPITVTRGNSVFIVILCYSVFIVTLCSLLFYVILCS